MPKRVDWKNLSLGWLGNYLFSDPETSLLKEEGSNPGHNTGILPYEPNPTEKWSLDYRLKSTNFLQEPTVIFKFGGSAWRQENWRTIIVDRIKQLLELQKNYPVILTTGGGRVQEVSKDMYDALDVSEETYRQSAGRALVTQAQTLADLLGNKGLYVEPDTLHYITTGMLKDKIPVVSMLGRDYIDYLQIEEGGAKRYVSRIPEDQSDAHTMVIGHYFLQKGVVFGKVTNGIWVVDPNVNEGHGEIYRKLQDSLKGLGYTENVRLPQIKATDVLEGRINRMGKDFRSQHLAEDLGLRLYLNPQSTVQWLQVIDIRDSAQVSKAFEGYGKGIQDVGSLITKG